MTSRGKIKFRAEESFDKHGRWVREFSVRSDVWPLLEHWAAEHDFHLSGMKANRRLYQKGEEGRTYVHLVEFRLIDTRLILTSWIHVGWLSRVLNFFRVPAQMTLVPSGFWGARRRRLACRDVNALLLRLRQGLIGGSNGFHWADFSESVLVLGVVVGVSLLSALFFDVSGLEWHEGLSNMMLLSLGRGVGLVALVGLVLALVQFVLELRWVFIPVWRMVICFATSLGMVLTTIAITSHTSSEYIHSRVAHHCLFHPSVERCQLAMGRLDVSERAELMKSLDSFKSELAKR